jgi:hypothetical protein
MALVEVEGNLFRTILHVPVFSQSTVGTHKNTITGARIQEL